MPSSNNISNSISFCEYGFCRVHLLECGHIVQTAEEVACHPNCQLTYRRYPTMMDGHLAAQKYGVIACDECVRRKVFLRDILANVTDVVDEMEATEEWQHADKDKRAAILDALMTKIGMKRVWDEKVEVELRSTGKPIGRPFKTAEDEVAELLGGMGLEGDSGSRSAEKEDVVMD